MLDWRCLPLAEVEPAARNGTCDVVPGMRQLSSDARTATLAFSSLTYQGGLQVLTTASTGSSSIWLWTSAFTWQLWLATGGTMLAVGLLAWGVELATHNLEPGVQPFQQTVWEALGFPIFVRMEACTPLPRGCRTAVAGRTHCRPRCRFTAAARGRAAARPPPTQASWLEPVSNAGWILVRPAALLAPGCFAGCSTRAAAARGWAHPPSALARAPPAACSTWVLPSGRWCSTQCFL